jgi:peptide/nickel transport system substrate-binding protein
MGMDPRRSLSRREALQLLGVTGAGLALAACGTGGQGQAKNPSKEYHGAWPYSMPPKGNYNLIAPVAILGDGPYIDLITPPMGYYYWRSGKWFNLMGESWGFDKSANTFTAKLRKGVKWDDGKPVTSKDLVTTLLVQRINKNAVWSYIDSVEATDDQTVVAHMSTPSTIVERYIVKAQIFSDAQYGEFARRAQQLFASGQDLDSPAGKSLQQDLQAFRPNNITASGPFKIDPGSLTNSQLTLVKNKSGLNADKIAFEKVVLYNGETPTVTPVVLQKKVDYATHGFPPATASQFLQEGIRILRPPTYGGNGLIFNFDKAPEFKDMRARQAIAYAVNRAQNAQVSLGKSAKAVKYMVGFSDVLVPKWVNSSEVSKLETYGFDQDKAGKLLEAAGWKKSGGGWHKPDGTPAEYEMLFPAEFADTSAATQDAAGQLTKFGIKVTPRSETFTQWPIDLAKGNFQLGAMVWGATTQPHPQFAYVVDLFRYNYVGASIGTNTATAANQGGKGMNFPLTQQTSRGMVDMQKLVIDSAMGLDETAQKKNVTEVALAFNELQPIITFHERYGNNPALEGTRVQSWPPDSDPIYDNAPYGDNFTVLLMYTGGLKPT